MNKIHNNLTIDNLIKTDWFNQFNESQIIQIRWGLEEHLDVSIYAKSEFDDLQMEQIRLGLEQGLNVSSYAKTEYSWEQMKKIREKLRNEQNI